MIVVEALFWSSILLLLYPYLIYPALIYAFSRAFPQHRERTVYHNDWPSVTLIISAYNEATVIAEKIRNALALDYPADRLQILVISDASDDGTDEIVKELGDVDPRVGLFRQQERKGKTSGLNAGISQLQSELIVFSDANAMYREDAIKQLTKHFKDQRVGYVVGAALYNEQHDSLTNESEDTYWSYELKLKQWESDFYSVVGGDGAIYAIRRELYRPLAEDDINDFINPLQIIAGDHLGLFEPDAVCFEDTAEDFTREFKRKRRIVNRSWRAFSKSWSAFSLTRHGRFLFTLISHKVIRWFSFLFIITAFLTSVILTASAGAPFYALALFGILACFALVAVGRELDKRRRAMPKLVSIAYYFFFVNYYALLGIIDNFRGVKHVTWEHVRDSK